jgi:hypothetical protein
VKSSPRPAPAGSQKPYEVDAAWEEMEHKHPQACGEMRAANVKLAEARAGL